MQSSYSTYWIAEADRDRFRRSCFIVGSAMLLAITPSMLAVRTHLMKGLGPHTYWLLPVVAVFMITICLGGPARFRIPTWTRWFVLSIIALPLVPLPLQIGLAMLFAGGVFRWSSRERSVNISAGFFAIAGAWLIVIVLAFLQTHAEARLSSFEALTRPVAWLLHVFGADAIVSDPFLIVALGGESTRVLLSPDKFGGSFVISALAALVVLGSNYGVGWRRILIGAAGVVIYATLRVVWLIGKTIDSGMTLPWWEEHIVLLSYAPMFVFLLPLIRPTRRATVGQTSEDRDRVETHESVSRRGRFGVGHLLLLCGAVSGLMLSIGWYWVSPGVPKRGTVMIDERYSRWEWSEDPIDTERFGVKTVYSYYNMAEAIGHYFDVVRNFDDITAERLDGVSVLVLKTPTMPYPDEALQAIWEFVEAGGGIWLIGDHTNVFGMSGYLNRVAEPYGIVNLYDSVLDPVANRQVSLGRPLDHPIVRDRPLFVGMTGNTVIAPWWINDVVLTQRLLRDNADFSSNAAFGDFLPELDERVGPTVQAVALHNGAGRVALWSDSTVFSNFGIFLPGKLELSLGYVNWLNRRNSGIPWRAWLIGGGLMFTGITIVLCLLRGEMTLLAGAGGWIGAAGASLLIPLLYDAFYPPLSPYIPFDDVAVYEPDFRSMHLPLLTTFDVPRNDGYHTSVIAAQRVGKRPRVVQSLDQLLSAPMAIVLQGNQQKWKQEDVEKMAAYIANGGELIVLDAGAPDSNLLEALADHLPFEVRPYSYELPEPLLRLAPNLDEIARANHSMRDADVLPKGPRLVTVNGTELGTTRVSYTIEGGDPLLKIQATDEVVAARIAHGSGSLIVTATDRLFCDATLGENSTVPDAKQYALLTELFQWFKGDS